MTLDDLLERFLDSRRLLGLSPKTITCYKDFVGFFVSYIGEDTPLEYLNYSLVEKYLFDLFNRPISANTRASYIRHLKVFLKWTEKTYRIDLGAANIKVPKTPKKNIYIYTDDEICLLFQSISAPSYWLTLRNTCIVALMLDSGLRQSEVSDLLYKNINLKKSLITVTGKGNKDRTVKVGETSKMLLQKYFEHCPYTITEYAFVDKSGAKISPNAIKSFVYHLNAILPFEISSHKFRHNFATNYCLDQYERYGSVDIYQLKALMGHEDVKTTERYLHIANEIIASNCAISHIDNILNLKN